MARIMVIDDNEDILILVKKLLEMNKYDVTTFRKAREALEYIKKGNIPDLAIVDLGMADMSGTDFCEDLAKDEKLKNMKIVLFTASVEPDKFIIEKYGLLGYILKPFHKTEFLASIKEYLSK